MRSCLTRNRSLRCATSLVANRVSERLFAYGIVGATVAFAIGAFVPIESVLAQGPDTSRMINSSGDWKEYKNSRTLTEGDAAVAAEVIDEIFQRSTLKKQFDSQKLRVIAQSVIMYSSVDTIDMAAGTTLFYNNLADVFSLATYADDGKLKGIDIASGRAIAKAMDVPATISVAADTLLQRPTVYLGLKSALLRASRDKKDISAIFRQRNFDQDERDYLAAGLLTMVSGIANRDDGACAEFAAGRRGVIVSNPERMDGLSPEVRDSYQLIMSGPEDSKGRVVVVYGDTRLNRSRTVTVIERVVGACKILAEITQTVRD